MSLDELSDAELVVWFVGMSSAAEQRYPMAPEAQPYGLAPEQVVDWWGAAEADVVVASVHGGYFAAEYDRSVNEPLARMLAANGILVANIDYRRAGSCTAPIDTVSDVRQAIAAVAERAGERPIVVVGHSAGGYLAIAGSSVPGVTAAIPLAPVTQLVGCSLGGWDEGSIANWIGCQPGDDPERWAALELLDVGWGAVPMVVLHGEDDRVVPPSHSMDFTGTRPGTEISLLPGAGHYEFLDPESAPAALVLDWTRRLATGG